MVLLLSFIGEWILAAAIVSVITGFIAWGAVKLDMEENPWKYREWLDADEAKKKAKQAKHNSQLPRANALKS